MPPVMLLEPRYEWTGAIAVSKGRTEGSLLSPQTNADYKKIALETSYKHVQLNGQVGNDQYPGSAIVSALKQNPDITITPCGKQLWPKRTT